ncbi:MAG TPA: hypothetical protein VM144_13525 [Aestuariivirga sp.]|nr:hypothetical protein [Aestuariivirga sp.]
MKTGDSNEQELIGNKMRTIHFIHIGKTAGTQIKQLASQINGGKEECTIIAHPHRISLANLPAGSEYFFSIRSPESRFVSGFYSRKRMGQPRYNVEWTQHEREAYENFHHANDLAEALFEEGLAGARALSAMKSIEHLARGEIDYFLGLGYFLKMNPPLAIIRQEKFAEDIARLFRILRLKNQPIIDHDPVAAHKNIYTDAIPLSEKAKDNIRRWYAQDCEFYKICVSWISGNLLDL